MNFEEYLNNNYVKNLKVFNDYCYKNYNNKLSRDEIEDLYQGSILNVLQSKSYSNNTIKDYNGYFWIILRNDTVAYLKNKYKTVKVGDEKVQIQFINILNLNRDESLSSEEENEFSKRGNVILDNLKLGSFKEGGFDLLVSRLKVILTPNQYHIFLNMIYNDITYRDIADIIGYSTYYIYHHNKKIWEKIKNELERNNGDYFNF